MVGSRVADPNQLCSDPDPASHVDSDTDLAKQLIIINIRSDPDLDLA